MSRINMVGLLLTKNEEKIAEEVLTKNEKFFDSIYALDGSSDDTPNILGQISKIKKLILEKDLNLNDIKDGVRQVVLEEIKKNESYENTWVTLMHGDEIFYHDPRKVAEEANSEGCDGVKWYAMHYFLHTTDKDRWDELSKKSVEERVTWYATNEQPCEEFRQFKLYTHSVFNINTHGFLEPWGLTKMYSKTPIYKHYKAYDPNIILDGIGRWGKQGSSIFVDKYTDNCGNYRQAHQFLGSFNQWEKGLEHLN